MTALEYDIKIRNKPNPFPANSRKCISSTQQQQKPIPQSHLVDVVVSTFWLSGGYNGFIKSSYMQIEGSR